MSVVYDSSFTLPKVCLMVNDEEALQNLIGKEYELVATHRTCSKCNISMKWQCIYTWKMSSKDVKSVEHTYGFRCSKCHAVKPYRHKSVFAGSHLSVGKCILVMYYWFKKQPQEQCVHDLGIDKETVRKKKTVEIDETCLGKLKYHRGLRKATQVWVLGVVERSSAGDSGFKFRCTIVSDRSEATMIPFLNKWIRPHTTIISDCWAAYNVLSVTDATADAEVKKRKLTEVSAAPATEPKRRKKSKQEYLKEEVKALVDLLRASETPWYTKAQKQTLCMYQAAVASVISFFDRRSWCKETTPPAVVTQPGKKYKKRTVDEAAVERLKTTVAKKYNHQTVNHSYTFKNKVTGACTNAIEGRWRHMKANLPSNGTRRTMLPSYLCEHMYRCAYASRDKKYDFGTFLKHFCLPTYSC